MSRRPSMRRVLRVALAVGAVAVIGGSLPPLLGELIAHSPS